MLLHGQIAELAADLQNEARQRPYIRALVNDLVDDELFWRLMFEMLELVAHRHGYVIAEKSLVVPASNPRSTMGTVDRRKKTEAGA